MASLEAPRRISDLDALNLILQNAGEDPVTTFGPNSKPTAQKAKEMLAEESIQLQSEGWNFCTTRQLKLDPSTTGDIYLPDNLIAFSPTYYSIGLSLQEDGNRLFNAGDNTHKFTSPVYIEAVLARPFNDLPQPVRWFIAVTAAMRFQNSENPGGAGLRVASADVSRAKAALEKYDRRLRKGGLRVHNPHFRRLRGNR